MEGFDMQNYYRINVSKNGYYLFATEQGRITSEKEIKQIVNIFKEKFPSEDGYNITCTYRKYCVEHINCYNI